MSSRLHKWFRQTVLQALVSSTLMLGMLGASSTPAQAVDTYWQVASGNWLNGANWTAGVPGFNDTAHINNGGTASITSFVGRCRGLRLGDAGAESGTLDITGGNLTLNEHMCVGDQGTGVLCIQDGATFSHSAEVYAISIGAQSTGDGNVVVSGPGSIWSWPGGVEMWVGVDGRGAVTIQDGGEISGGSASIGPGPTGDGSIIVTGTGSTWTNGGLWVAELGTGELTIENGGAVSTIYAEVGALPGSNGSVTVNGSDSMLSHSSYLSIGVGGTGSLTVEDGAGVSVEDTSGIGALSGSYGTVTVDGSNSRLVCSGGSDLIIGYGGTGVLNIENGAIVANRSGYIGYESGSDGNVLVDGDGSRWFNIHSLYVGGSDTSLGGTGVLTLANDGYVCVCDTLRVWQSGTVNVNGGELRSGVVEIDDGAITLAGGTHQAHEALYVGYSAGFDGTYTVAGGGLTAPSLYVGYDGSGTFEISGVGAQITVSDLLRFGADSVFTAVPRSRIHMTGADFENLNTDETDLAGLANLELIFEGGSGQSDDLEVACKDQGAVRAGYNNNFALRKLTVGGADVGIVRLVDNTDNANHGGGGGDAEALYVELLVLRAGSTLDLNGLHLYYTRFIDGGGTILSGSPIPVPPSGKLLASDGAEYGYFGWSVAISGDLTVIGAPGDADNGELSGSVNDPPLAAGAVGLYYNRNRWLQPNLGRFLQRDVNASGMPLLRDATRLGETIDLEIPRFSPELHFGDGANLYCYLLTNPGNRLDPRGLFSFGDFLAGLYGQANLRASQAASAGVASGFFSSVANALALRNQMLTSISNAASRMGASRALDFLSRAHVALNNMARFTNSNYRRGFQDLYGSIIAKWSVHHTFPNGGELGRWFASRGINPNVPLFLKQLSPEQHRWVHNTFGWIPRWKEFMERNRDATIDEIFDFAQRLAAQAGI